MFNSIDLSEAFKQNIIILKLVGIWKYDKNFCYTIHKNLLMFISLTFCILSTLETAINFSDEVISNLYLLPALFEGVIKLAVCQKNLHLILATLHLLKTPYFQPKNKNQNKILVKSVKISQFGIIGFICTMSVCVCGVYVSPLIKGEQTFFVNIWIPFGYQKSYYFKEIYIFSLISTTIIVFVNMSVDSFLYISCIQIGAQFDCIHDTLKYYQFKKILIKRALIDCICHHKQILKYITIFMNAYNEVVMVQIVSSTFSMCMAMYQMSMVSINLLFK